MRFTPARARPASAGVLLDPAHARGFAAVSLLSARYVSLGSTDGDLVFVTKGVKEGDRARRNRWPRASESSGRPRTITAHRGS
jgi:hypothetical protein